MSAPEIAKKYGVTKQAVYQRIRDDEARKMNRSTNGYGLDTIRGVGQGEHRIVDPETGFVVENRGNNAMVIGRMGDEKVTAFVNYHMDMLAMRQGVDKTDVKDLYARFIRYLDYCAQKGIIPNNMNCYFAIGLSRQNISAWSKGTSGTPAHKEFAETVTQFFASVHEQAATDGIVNPIYSMWLQKAHDHMIEAQKLEVVQDDPLGQKRSAEEIAKAYSDVELPD